MAIERRGATWESIKTSLSATTSTMRPEIAVNVMPNGDTRMYVAEGASGSPTARLFRADSVRTGAPAFTNLTSSNRANPGFGSYNYCSGQCWYDNFVVTPAGYPDVVYLTAEHEQGTQGATALERGHKAR